MSHLMGRAFNPLTQCWERPGLISLPVEQTAAVQRHGATMLDLLALLIWRDQQAARIGATR